MLVIPAIDLQGGRSRVVYWPGVTAGVGAPTDRPDVIAARFHRRDILRGALGVAAIAATVSPLAIAAARDARPGDPRFGFSEVESGVDENHHVADGYDADVLIRWGDPVLAGAPAFDPSRQTAAAQRLQFGYNNDFIGYLPMPGAADPSHHGLLVVNHEYTSEELMFPAKERGFANTTKNRVDLEMAAHGGTVIEIMRVAGKWRVVAGSRYARRIDADTAMEISGPAAGHARMRTRADPSGRHGGSQRKKPFMLHAKSDARPKPPTSPRKCRKRVCVIGSCQRAPMKGSAHWLVSVVRRDTLRRIGPPGSEARARASTVACVQK